MGINLLLFGSQRENLCKLQRMQSTIRSRLLTGGTNMYSVEPGAEGWTVLLSGRKIATFISEICAERYVACRMKYRLMSLSPTTTSKNLLLWQFYGLRPKQ